MMKFFLPDDDAMLAEQHAGMMPKIAAQQYFRSERAGPAKKTVRGEHKKQSK